MPMLLVPAFQPGGRPATAESDASGVRGVLLMPFLGRCPVQKLTNIETLIKRIQRQRFCWYLWYVFIFGRGLSFPVRNH